MIIRFSPQRRDDTLEIRKRSDVLTINGERFDFRVIPDGATLPASAITCDWIAGDVSRINGQLIIPFILPHGPEPSDAVMHPADLVDPSDGIVELPR